MSRHKKVKALDYDEEYDDYYGDYDDDDDFDVEGFETKYLSTGIDLNEKIESSDKTSIVSKQRQTIIDEVLSSSAKINANPVSPSKSNDTPILKPNSYVLDTLSPSGSLLTPRTSDPQDHIQSLLESATSDLTKIAIRHYDKHQWQLPLLEMDQKFRDKTYYKHYDINYNCASPPDVHSKLGTFLDENKGSLNSVNPVRLRLKQLDAEALDKHAEILGRSIELRPSLGKTQRSFLLTTTQPKPEEKIEIVDYRFNWPKAQSRQPPKQTKETDQQKAARFEYHGKASNKNEVVKQSASSSDKQAGGNSKQSATKSNATTVKQAKKQQAMVDLTIREGHTAEQLDELSRKYQESLTIAKNKIAAGKANTPNKNPKLAAKSSLAAGKSTSNKTEKPQPITKSATANSSQSKPLATLTEKRQDLKKVLKLRAAEPSPKDLEAFKRQALRTSQEYEELMRSSRPRINLVVVGHVDAGKSTLVGHLLFKLGQVTGKQMHRNEVDSQRSGKASFKFAWALDETEEERARGVTVDIALTKFETAHKDVVLLDAPGHVDFIPAVISGAAQADAALLVVDATRGEFETGFSCGGQTREHTLLVRSLGVKSLVVVVNKMDNVDWSSSRFGDIVDQLKPFLKQVGFNLEKDVQFVVCSGLTGENLVQRRMEKMKRESSHPQLQSLPGEIDWNKMPSLLEAIDNMKLPERMVDKPTRVCVTDVFKGMSSGVFLGAKVAAGKIESKQKLLLLPPNETCEVKQVEVRDSKETKAFSGDIVTVTVTGLDMNKFYRGCMLCDPIIPCHVTNRFQARIIMFDNADTILIKGTSIEAHINGTFESGVVRNLKSLLNKNTGELVQKKPRCIVKNSSAIVQIKLSRVVCCELYEENKSLGRFMIRCYGKTIAAGLITKLKSPKLDKSGRKIKTK